MNVAFLVEGITELKLYPTWITHFSGTNLTECTTGYQDVVQNQFTIFNVQGIGKMRTEIPAAIHAIHANPVFDYLVIIVDADANHTRQALNFIQTIINDSNTPSLPSNCQLEIMVQQVCIETWFIGHIPFFVAAKQCVDIGITNFMNNYDAQNNDPELMPRLDPQIHSISAYHAAFLKKMLKGANRNWRYSKSSPQTIIDIAYLQQLEQRLTQTPQHLQTFSAMRTFLQSL